MIYYTVLKIILRNEVHIDIARLKASMLSRLSMYLEEKKFINPQKTTERFSVIHLG